MQFTNGASAAVRLQEDDCTVAAIAASQQASFQEVFAGSPRQPVELGRIESLNFSKGQAVAIILYRLPRAGE
jgi:hypothetical protein